jgi:phage shock protein E
MKKLAMVGAILMSLMACGKSYNDTHVNALQKVADGAVLIDVRSEAEFREGHLEGAIRITHSEILEGVSALNVNKDTPIVLYCRSGNRSGQATSALQSAGFNAVTNGGAYESLLAASNQ